VLVPCFTIYNTYPIELLRNAQNGDNDALEKLIRLDKSIIFEPKISELIHQAQALKAQARIAMIKKALVSKPVKLNMNMKAIKCNLGGLISYLSDIFKQKITAADIRKLFDAIACDKGIDNIDPDLSNMTPETFEKAIQRQRNFWNIILVDKK
jgi:ASC-1-like (ASCH) protein